MDAQRSTSSLIVRLSQRPLVAVVVQAQGVVVPALVRLPVAEAAPVLQLPVLLAPALPQDVAQRPLQHRHPRQRQVEADRAALVGEVAKVVAAGEAAPELLELPQKP